MRQVFWRTSPCARAAAYEDDLDSEVEQQRHDGGTMMGHIAVMLLVVLAIFALVCFTMKRKGGRCGCGGYGGGSGGRSARVSLSPSGACTTLTSAKEVEECIKKTMADKSVCVIMFHASWCGHCKETKPEFEKCAKLCEGENCFFCDIDADQHMDAEAMKKFKIEGFPTILLCANGRVKEELDPQSREASKMKAQVTKACKGQNE